MKVGTLEIELLANMARLQTQMELAKSMVGNAVSRFNQLLGAIGVGITFAGLTSLVRNVADVGDKFNDLRKITGLAVKDLAGLEKVAELNGTSLDGVSKAIGIMSKNIAAGSPALAGLGISIRTANGDFRNTKDILLDMADRFSRMEDGVLKTAVAQKILGKSGAELIPMLNEGKQALAEQIEKYGEASGMTDQLAQESDRFNDMLTELQARVFAVKTSFVGDMLPTLNNIIAAMMQSESSTSRFSFAATVLVPVLKGLAIAGYTVVDTFRGMGREIVARAAQLVALANLDFSGAKFIGNALAEDNEKSRAEYDKFVQTILNTDKSIEQLNQTQTRSSKIERDVAAAIQKTNVEKKQKKELSDAENLALLRQEESTRQIIELSKKVESVTDSVATKQEIYNEKLEELNRLKPYLSVETYSRALNKAQDELVKTEKDTGTATDQMSQLWMQAGRNIQSTLANSIFNFFDDGLKGMVKNVVSAVGRIASEFAALKLAQNIGLSSMFGGIGGTGINALNLASLGANAASLFRGGFGLNSLIGGGLSSIAGSGLIGSFGAGLSGGSRAAAFIGAESATAGAGLAAGMGSAFAAAAGPLMIAAAATAGMKALAGDKRMGGGFGNAINAIGDLPVIGDLFGLAPLLNGLFGHGPMKFRQQSLQGSISADGFDGDITNVFRAKGGLFMGNKHKSITEQLPAEIQSAFDETITGFYKSAHDFAKNLGLDINLVDGFTQELQIKSDKNQKLSEEAIKNFVNGIGDTLAKNLIGEIDNFKKVGETSFQTLARINAEFDAMTSGAMNLGASMSYAKELVKSMSIESRTAFVDLAGGVDNLTNLTGFFAQNFLTEQERLNQATERLGAGMRELGVQSGLTNDQLKTMVQSLDISNDTRIKLLQLAPALFAVNAALDAQKTAAEETARAQRDAADEERKRLYSFELNSALTLLQRSIDAQRKKITDRYELEAESVASSISKVTDSISRLRSLSDALKTTISSINPLSRDAAKRQIEQAFADAQRGKLADSKDLDEALKVLGQKSTSGFSSGIAYDIEQAKTANLLSNFKGLTDKQLTTEEQTLIQLQDQQKTLKDGFDREIASLDSILESAQRQIDLLTGLNTAILSLNSALGNLNRVIQQGNGSAITNPYTGITPVTGNPNISASQIVDYFNQPHRPEEIIRDMQRYGVTTQQVIGTGKFSQAQVDQFFKDNPNLSRESVDGKGSAGLSDVNKVITNILTSVSNSVAKSSESNERTARILRAATKGNLALNTK